MGVTLEANRKLRFASECEAGVHGRTEETGPPERRPARESWMRLLDAVSQLFAFDMRRNRITCGTHQRREKRKKTCCNAPSVSKTRLNNHICWVSAPLSCSCNVSVGSNQKQSSHLRTGRSMEGGSQQVCVGLGGLERGGGREEET